MREIFRINVGLRALLCLLALGAWNFPSFKANGQAASQPATRPTTRPSVEVIERTTLGGLAPQPSRSIVLTGANATQVMNIFAAAGQGRESRWAGTWTPRLEVRLNRTDGKTIKVFVDWRFKVWSEGDGDWEIDEASTAVLTKLLSDTGQVN